MSHEQPDQRRESPISWLTWGSRSTSTGGATGPPRVPPTLIGGRTGTVLISPSAGEGGGREKSFHSITSGRRNSRPLSTPALAWKPSWIFGHIDSDRNRKTRRTQTGGTEGGDRDEHGVDGECAEDGQKSPAALGNVCGRKLNRWTRLTKMRHSDLDKLNTPYPFTRFRASRFKSLQFKSSRLAPQF